MEEEMKSRKKGAESEEQFSLYMNRNAERVAGEEEKRKRRWKFQEKIKKVPISIDEYKRVQIEIQRDKAKDPLKYQFLSQKSLNEFQIYGEFKEFAIELNPR